MPPLGELGFLKDFALHGERKPRSRGANDEDFIARRGGRVVVGGNQFVTFAPTIVVGGVVTDEQGIAVVIDVVGTVKFGVDDDGEEVYRAVG